MEINICRICLENNEKKLIHPCKCKGTNKYVHLECLNKWRLINGRDSENYRRCNSCLFLYKTKNKFYKKVLKNIFSIIKKFFFPTLTFFVIIAFIIIYFNKLFLLIKNSAIQFNRRNIYLFFLIFPIFNFITHNTLKYCYNNLFFCLNRNEQNLIPFLYLIILFWSFMFPIFLFSFIIKITIFTIESNIDDILNLSDDVYDINDDINDNTYLI